MTEGSTKKKKRVTEGGSRRAGKGEREGHRRQRRRVTARRGRGMASQREERQMSQVARKGKRDGIAARRGRVRGATGGRSRV